MSWDEWKQQRAHYLKKNARIAELEAQLASAYRDKMHLEDTCNFQHEMLLSCQRERDALEKELLEERASYEAERQRLRDALGSLSNEFDRMHTMVSSRYVAERLQALEKKT